MTPKKPPPQIKPHPRNRNKMWVPWSPTNGYDYALWHTRKAASSMCRNNNRFLREHGAKADWIVVSVMLPANPRKRSPAQPAQTRERRKR